jgi:hypothetical protein
MAPHIFCGRGSRALVVCTPIAFIGCSTGQITGDVDAGPSKGSGGSEGHAGGSVGVSGSENGKGSGGASGSENGKGSGGASGSENGKGSGGVSGAGNASGSGGRADAGSGGGRAPDAGDDAGNVQACRAGAFCENFDDHAGVGAISDKQKFGPWHAALQAGAQMSLDGAHTASGTKALHVHIDDAVTAGGRLFADGQQPLFVAKPTHVYGRMMMYIDPNGTSVHWTFFGVNGNAEPSSPAVGRSASYLMSSLPKNGVNTYSFVYGLSAMGADGYHDCSSQSTTSMPSSWTCVSFDMDSVTRKLRMYAGGAPTPILSIDDHGKGCVAPTSVTSPWYGPAVSQLYVGAWSFHEMNAPLDVWIDDLVVDTEPVACPPGR